MRAFFDSSAFVKRYVDEAGTADVIAWCEQATELALSIIAIPELLSAFRRLHREGRLTEGQYQQLKGDLMADVADAMVSDTSPWVIQKAVEVLEAHPLRAMDAIHIGCAVLCAADIFVSADARQCEAAQRCGLKVVAI